MYIIMEYMMDTFLAKQVQLPSKSLYELREVQQGVVALSWIKLQLSVVPKMYPPKEEPSGMVHGSSGHQ